MARCGCGGDCSCSIVAGDGITVAGSGSGGNPYVISGNVPCTQVRSCISAGSGLTYNPATGVMSARPSIDAGNSLVFGTDQGLYVPANQVSCDDVRPCLSGGDGIIYNPVTGLITTRLSTDPGNQAIFGTDDGVYVPTGTTTVVTACGLVGDGSALTPLAAAVGSWPYPCDVDDEAGVVVCDSAGVLRGEPRSHAAMTSVSEVQAYANIAVPAGAPTPVRTITANFTNPDPCRTAIVVAEQELEFDIDLPSNARVSYGFTGDDMVTHINRGATTENGFSIQVTKVLPRGTIAPGATIPLSFDALVGNGTNGATYSNIQQILRALIITQ